MTYMSEQGRPEPPVAGNETTTLLGSPERHERLRASGTLPLQAGSGRKHHSRTRQAPHDRKVVIMTESDLSDLRARAENGDEEAVDELVELATERGDMDELRRLADRGNATAADQLIELATERGDINELRRLADKGNTAAAEQLMELTAE
jgi:hypothetical protein